jgi:hypothetical protein
MVRLIFCVLWLKNEAERQEHDRNGHGQISDLPGKIAHP